ncbi:MAG: autotransporter outer membrane beta-barrel domain-containing protein [Acidobacteria bacterium]|nr:autotransporter outer membrane beta-barrel domain-containing protein [Acidobacteriota bacterium]
MRGALGSWMLPVAQLRGLSHAQYLDRWSMPIEPGRDRNNSVAFVLLPAGTHIWAGTAGPIADQNGVWGNGGGVQYFVGREANVPAGSFQTTPDMFYTTPQPMLTLQKYSPRVAGPTAAMAAYLDGLAVEPYSSLDGALVQLDVLPLIDTADSALLAGAIQSLGPERHVSTALAGIRAATFQLDLFAQRGDRRAGILLGDVRAGASDGALGRAMPQSGSTSVGKHGAQAWFTGGTSSDRQSSRHQGLTGYTARTYSAVGGVDVGRGKAWSAGIGGGVSSTPLDWNSGRGDAKMTTGLVAAYTGVRKGRLFLDGAITGGRSGITTRRPVEIPGVTMPGLPVLTSNFALSARSSHTAWTMGAQADVGVNVSMGALVAQPLLGIAGVRYSQGALAEDGADGVNLSLDAYAASDIRVRTGLRLAPAPGHTERWRPEAQVIWSRAMSALSPTFSAGLRDATGRFTFTSPSDAREHLTAGLGLVATFRSTAIRVRYDGTYSRDYRSHAFGIVAGIVF